MNVTLNSKLSHLIEGEVRAGRFQTAEEMIAAGISRVLAESDFSAEELADFRVDAEIGIHQADRSEFAPFTASDIMAEGRELLKNKSQSKAV